MELGGEGGGRDERVVEGEDSRVAELFLMCGADLPVRLFGEMLGTCAIAEDGNPCHEELHVEPGAAHGKTAAVQIIYNDVWFSIFICNDPQAS